MADRGNRAHEQWVTYLTSFCQMLKMSHILMSILTSHVMVTKNPQNVHRKYFWAILLTFIFDVKIDINICEPHYVNLFFL